MLVEDLQYKPGYLQKRINLVYCIDRQPDGRYTLLNRNYKPVGMDTHEWVDYQQHATVIKGLTPDIAAMISVKISAELQRIYLFGDGSAPWDSKTKMAAYEARQNLLLTLIRNPSLVKKQMEAKKRDEAKKQMGAAKESTITRRKAQAKNREEARARYLEKELIRKQLQLPQQIEKLKIDDLV